MVLRKVLDRARSTMLLSIQYLRGIASFMVVLHHIRNPWPKLYNPLEKFDMGGAGVDIFFIISGIVMYISSRDERPEVFVSLRLIRVAPLYWIVTFCILCLYFATGAAGLNLRTIDDLFFSLFFVPHQSSIFVNTIWPLLNPGWTLYFEMFFYLIFAVGLLFRKPLLVTGWLISLFVLLGLFTATNESIFGAYTRPIQIYTHPLMLEFLVGIVLGWLYLNVNGGPNLWILLPLGFAALLLANILRLPFLFFQNGLCAVLIMIGAIFSESAFMIPEVSWLKRLGDASYSIYLTHALTLFVVRRAFLRLPLEGVMQFTLFALVAATASLIIGFSFYYAIERPMTRWLRSWYLSGLTLKSLSS